MTPITLSSGAPIRWFVLLLAVAAAGAGGCVESGGANSPEVKALVSTTAPSPRYKLNIDFDGKVKLIGYDVATTAWTAGGSQTVTWYWKSEKKLDAGWKLFTHVGTDKAPVLANVDNDSVIRSKYPPSEWQPGQYIRDVQTIKLPGDFRAKRATVYVGIWKGKKRVPVTAGPHDKADRAKAFGIDVSGGSPATNRELPELSSIRVADGPEIDGKLDDKEWLQAPASRLFVNTLKGTPAEPETTVRSVWTDKNVYFAFTVKDTLLKSSFTNHDDHLWTQDCVEIMLDPGGDGLNYFEMQVSPRGTVFETRYDSRRVPRPFGHLDWDSHMTTKVIAQGKVDDDESDGGYTVEIAIPWSAFNAGDTPATTPGVGDSWRGNFYVMDTQKDGQRAAGWSPLFVGDFHVPSRFGKINFVAPQLERAIIDLVTKHSQGTAATASPNGAAEKPRTARDMALEDMQHRQAVAPKPGETLPTKDHPKGQ